MTQYTTHFRVYCPRCGHKHNMSVIDARVVRAAQDQPCAQCYHKGQDSYVVGHDYTKVGA